MEDPNFIALNKNVDFNTVVETIIKKRCIIDYGIVEAVPADGVVEVAVAVSTTPENMYYLTCVLANIASSSFTVNVKPNIGDRVLVVYPRLYDENMFTVPESEEDKKKIIVNKHANGYNILSGIAILLNQYKKDSHKNIIDVFDGNISLKLGYDENNDKYKFELNSSVDGSITFVNEKSSTSIDKDGYLHYANTDSSDNKSKIDFTSSGFTIQDKNGCKIVSDSSYITINGHLKVKK